MVNSPLTIGEPCHKAGLLPECENLHRWITLHLHLSWIFINLSANFTYRLDANRRRTAAPSGTRVMPPPGSKKGSAGPDGLHAPIALSGPAPTLQLDSNNPCPWPLHT